MKSSDPDVAGEAKTPPNRSIRDGRVAGTALAHRATLATGNIRHFEPLGVTNVDPWDGS